jgi:hypothetical protein
MGFLLAEEQFPTAASFIAAVRHSMARNYAGCFPPKGDDHAKSQKPSPGASYDPDRPCKAL